MDKDTALRKIQKCLALSKSSEPHEAAQAMKQAQALMRQFDIEHPELLAVGIEQDWARSRANKAPPGYEVMLANVVCRAFGCDLIFAKKWFAKRWGADELAGGYTFIGAGPAAKVAAYTFTVMARKLTAARAEYTKIALARYRKNKVAAADQFCAGWVSAMSRNVASAEVDGDRRAALDAYKGIHFETVPGKVTNRELANTTKAEQHHLNGWLEGRKEQVHSAIAPGAQQTLALL